jgi:ribonuclease D
MATARGDSLIKVNGVSASGSSLPALMAQARADGRLALDTEFMGEGRYRTLLCLVQLAAAEEPARPDGPSRIELIDPLQEELDAAPLADALADPAVEIVVHAGRQDIALLRRRLQTDVSNVFDTQVAAGFAGMGAQSSYDSLLAQVLGVRLAKSASFTRWDARPLSSEQLDYAREDVVHLLELAAELQRRLRELGRLEWARQECEPLARASDERDLDAIFARLPRVRNLSTASQAVARELVAWREQTAAAQDRTVQSILSDAVLVEIAKRRPTTAERLHDIRGAGQSGVRRRTEDVLKAVRRGAERPHEPLQEGARARPPDPPLIALAEALVRARAREADLAYELVASRADLQAIVTAWRGGVDRDDGSGEADVRTLKGWRRELVGGELLKLLEGVVSLSVGGGRLAIDS